MANALVLPNCFKSPRGFTLIELLISISIISILASVGIQQFSQYKVRSYDAHSKQALRDMHMLCNVYWLDTDPEQRCDIPTIKDTYYGFNQHSEVVATLPPSPLDNFCGAAKHNSSPNTYSIDSAAMISDNEHCGAGRAAELAAKAEAERIALEEKKKYESCENMSKEINQNAHPRKGNPTLGNYKGQFTGATFVPEKYFQEAESMLANKSGKHWTYQDTLDNQPLKGYCVFFPQPSTLILRRPGCNDISVDKGSRFQKTCPVEKIYWGSSFSTGGIKKSRSCKFWDENGRKYYKPCVLSETGYDGKVTDALRSFLADNNTTFTDGRGNKTDLAGRPLALPKSYTINDYPDELFACGTVGASPDCKLQD